MNLSKFDLNLSPFGVRVRIMPTFWLICALFSPFFTEFKGPWVVGLLSWTAGLLLAFLAHHLTQAALMRRLYGETPQIELGFGRSTSGELVFGGLTSCAKLEEASMKRALIAASGPVVGIALSVLAAKLLELAGLPFYTLPVFGFIQVPALHPEALSFLYLLPVIYLVHYLIDGFVTAGIVWGVFNLAPILPLNGGALLMSVLVRLFGKNGSRAALVISQLASIALVVYSLRAGAPVMTVVFAYTAYRTLQLDTPDRF